MSKAGRELDSADAAHKAARRRTLGGMLTRGTWHEHLEAFDFFLCRCL